MHRTGWDTNTRRIGARLTSTAAPSAEIQGRRRATRQAPPVETAWTEPEPVVKHPNAKPTSRQRRNIASLAEQAGVETPDVTNRYEAAVAVAKLKRLVKA